MPNGRTGMFRVPKSSLRTLIAAFPAATVIAETFGNPARAMTAGDVLDLLLPVEDHVSIEEQSHEYYIMRAGDNFDLWPAFMAGSPAFQPLKNLLRSATHPQG